jgi:hypothetical protein
MQGSNGQKRPLMTPYLDGIGYLYRLDIRPPVLERRVHVRYLGPAARRGGTTNLGDRQETQTPWGTPETPNLEVTGYIGPIRLLVPTGNKTPMPKPNSNSKPKPGLPVIAIAQLHGVDIAELLPPRSPHPPVRPRERIPLIDPVVKPEGCIRMTG